MVVGFVGCGYAQKADVAGMIREKYGFRAASPQEAERLLSEPGDYLIETVADPAVWNEAVKQNGLLLSFRMPDGERLEETDAPGGKGQVIDVAGKTAEQVCEEVYACICEYRFLRAFGAWRNRVDREIQADGIRPLLAVYDDYPYMKPYCDEFINFSFGGKRIRAYLVKLGYELCGKTANQDVMTAGLAYEIIQSGILIHDDVIDQSRVRRKKPTYHVLFGDNHLGVSRAICVGDIGILIANEILLYTDLPEDIKIKALVHQNKVYKLTIAGELGDIDLSESEQYSEDQIVSMYNLKTSWYTIVGPLQLGAILGGADNHLMRQIEQAGRLMGIAFQIKDDMLGIFESAENTGKSDLSDLQEGKKTIITEHFLSHADQKDIAAFHAIYGNRASGLAELQTIRELFGKTHTYEYTLSQCRHYLTQSRQIIMEMRIPKPCREQLLGFIDYQEKRMY
ncbi:MAG: polyprenyl synthetase family protein [Clostridia bacterium]|nr:polyprenyl synthetase family protein [Clostridia bacterium]